MKAGSMWMACAAGRLVAACGTTVAERAATGGLAGTALGAAVADRPLTGAVVGGAAGAAIGAATAPRFHDVNRRQYYDERGRRCYFYDPATRRHHWENGAPR